MSDTTIGAMRHRVILEAPLRVPDGAGGVIETWSEVATLWARIADRSGSESFSADGISGRLTHEITLRPHPDLVPRNRMRTMTRTYHILAVRTLGEPTSRLTCLCEERDL